MAFHALSGIFWILFLSSVERIAPADGGAWCGFPGAPAHGRPLPPNRARFRPGEGASFACDAGFALQGAPPFKRICTERGDWSGEIPVCERPLPAGDLSASSRAALSLYPASRASDGDPASCAYADKQRPRWMRLDMGRERRVAAVALTVPPAMYTHEPAQLTIYAISVRDSTTASYHKCATFTGRFASSTLRLQCAGGGVEGRYVHVEDERRTTDYFGLCEIHVYAHQGGGGGYECGEPERPLHGYSVRTESGSVRVRCLHGFRLQGPAERACGHDGRWRPAQQPLCEEISCPPLPPVLRGRVSYSGGAAGDSRPTLGATAALACDHGFAPTEGASVVCGSDGRWLPLADNMECRPVECGPPPAPFDAVLLNGTRFGGVALLSCPASQGKGAEPIHCREDGQWSTPTTQCANVESGLSRLGLVEEEQGDVPTGVVIGMAVVVFLLLLAVILVLLLKRRKVLRQNSADTLPRKDTSDPPPAYDNSAFYASVPPPDSTTPRRPSLLSTVLFPSQWRRRKSGSSPSGDSSSSSGMGVYEEVGRAVGGPTVAPGGVDKEVGGATLGTESEAVYAQVDLDEKRRSRQNRVERFEPVDPPEWEGTYRSEGAYDEVDLEPIKLRELPPIPPPEEGATYASLSFPLDPPPAVMKENELYLANDGLKV